jgi:hypothetical protein
VREEEWLTCDDPHAMFDRVEAGSSRKLHLFACACCRRIWRGIRDERGRAAVEGAEQFADDHISRTAFAKLSASAEEAYGEAFNSTHTSSEMIGLYAAHITAVENIEGWHLSDVLRATAEAAGYGSDESSAQADLLRDIFGNPFRPVVLDPAWLSSDVLALARGIYDERAFDRMPILADALQDAGCDNEDILTHCRDTSLTHVRGCWVVDLLLGK